jgi:CO/xanthine dehydrogenase Mo-binding subunit
VLFHTIHIGGDFGGKGAPGDAPAGYYLAKQTGRPIKFIVTSPEELSVGTPRHPSVITIKSGVKRDGTIVARDVRVIYNSGAYGGFRPPVMDGMLPGANQAGGQYAIPNLHIEGMMVYTNEMPRAYMRSPGQPQAVFSAEAHMDLIAKELGMDALEFRMKNTPRDAEGHETMSTKLFRAAAEAVGWGSPKPPNVGRGIAIASRTMGGGMGTSDITVNPDGTVTAVTGAPDVGTGTQTVVAQIVAECWGIPVEKVRLERADTDMFRIDAEAGASRMTNIVGHVAIAACDQVKEQLAPLAAAMLGSESATWADGGYRSPDGKWISLEDFAGEMIKPGDPAAHARLEMNVPAGKEPERTVQAAEVEVDPETGQVTVRKLATAQAVGTIINELGHQGQIDGCAIQGFGYALVEELAISEGRVLTGHFGDYKMPTIADVPPLTSINVESRGDGPFDAQAIGETGVVPTPAAIANAVSDAIGVPVTQLPISAERVLNLIDQKQS